MNEPRKRLEAFESESFLCHKILRQHFRTLKTTVHFQAGAPTFYGYASKMSWPSTLYFFLGRYVLCSALASPLMRMPSQCGAMGAHGAIAIAAPSPCNAAMDADRSVRRPSCHLSIFTSRRGASSLITHQVTCQPPRPIPAGKEYV